MRRLEGRQSFPRLEISQLRIGLDFAKAAQDFGDYGNPRSWSHETDLFCSSSMFPRGFHISLYGDPWASGLSLTVEAWVKQSEGKMALINVVVMLMVVGVLLWLVNRFIPMQATIKSILNGVVVIAVVLWLLNVFGLFNFLPHVRVGS
jgi:hypothetical protein